MTDSAESADSPLPREHENPRSSSPSPSNPDGYSSEVDQSLAVSSPLRDKQPFVHTRFLDQQQNSSGSTPSSSLETLDGHRSLTPLSDSSTAYLSSLMEATDDHEENSLIFLDPNLENGNYTNRTIFNISNDEEDDDSPKRGLLFSRISYGRLMRSMTFRDGDSDDALSFESKKPPRTPRRPALLVPEEEPKKIKPTGVGAGLWNLGNTCFINSVLQCFTHTVPLVQRLHSYDHLMCGSGFCVIRSLRDHIELALSSSGDAISPSNFVDNLNYFSSYFQKYHQEDAHEFLQSFLDKLEMYCLDSKKKTLNHSSQDFNIVEQVFGGRLMSRLRCCNCGSSSNTYEASVGFSLEIEDVDNLQSALKSFTRVEKLEDEFTCDNCKEKVSKEKQLMLDHAPLVATFHLKRFKNDGISVDKIYKHVEFPLELDLQPFTIGSQNDNKVGLKYHLYAFVEHIGSSLTSGHYFSYVRSSPNTWHKLDDSEVTRIHEDSVLSQDAYILFYARDSTPWFSSVFEQIKQCPEVNTQNSSPKSVLDTALRDCISDRSTETIDNMKFHESSNIVEVPITSLGSNEHKVLTNGISGFHCDEPKHHVSELMESKDDDVLMTDDSTEACDANDFEKSCTMPPQEETNLCQPVDRVMMANVCVPTLGPHCPDPSAIRHQDGGLTIPRGHLKVEKQQATCKKTSGNKRVSEPLDRVIALRYLKKHSLSSTRATLLCAAIGVSPNGSPTKRKQRMRKS